MRSWVSSARTTRVPQSPSQSERAREAEEDGWRIKARFLLAFGGAITYEQYDEMTPREVAVFTEEWVEANKPHR